jgi:CBS domain-containing protein
MMSTVGSRHRSGIYLESTKDEQYGVLPGEDRFVEDIMNRKAVTVDEMTSVKEAAEIMRKEGVTALVVCRNGDLTGAFTERDMVDGTGIENSPRSITVREVIKQREVVTCRENAILGDALRAMTNHQTHSIPVVNADGGLVGVLSLVDAIGALAPDVAATWLAKMQKPIAEKPLTSKRDQH